ncbi:MAG: LPS assembly lipoprotein LptE [Akkermansia sp.]
MRIFSHKTIPILLLTCLTLICSNCGYRLGGVKPEALSHISAVRMTVFINNSLEPSAGSLVTNAISEAIQRDGTFHLASKGQAQARIEGSIDSVRFVQLRSSTADTYKSTELGLELSVKYKVVDARDNKVLLEGEEMGSASFFSIGNQQTAKTNALSYAARLVAGQIAATITNG